MYKMIKATITLFIVIAIFIIAYAVLSQPVETVLETLNDAFESGNPDTEERVEADINILDFAFKATIVVAIIATILWYAIWGHKREYERY